MNKNLDRRIHPIAEADGLSPKKLVKPQHQPGVNPRRYNKRIKEGYEKRRQTIKRERARLLYGLEQKTSLKLTKIMTRKMSAHKHAMIKKCNYFPDEEHPT